MSFQIIYIVAVSVGLAFLIGYRLGRNAGFDEGYEMAKITYEEIGEFLGKEDREMLLK